VRRVCPKCRPEAGRNPPTGLQRASKKPSTRKGSKGQAEKATPDHSRPPGSRARRPPPPRCPSLRRAHSPDLLDPPGGARCSYSRRSGGGRCRPAGGSSPRSPASWPSAPVSASSPRPRRPPRPANRATSRPWPGTCRTTSSSATRATAAQLYNPRAIGFAPDGSVYIADALNERIRKIDGSGVISTFAGSGPSDSSGALQNGATPTGPDGDGGPSTQAVFNQPHGVAIDSKGNVYVADSNDQRTRKIDGSGTITTIAGTGDPKAPPCPTKAN